MTVSSDLALEPVHVICVSTAAPAACLEAVPAALRRCGGQVLAFSVKPSGDRFEAVLRVTGVNDAAAERIAAMIAAWPQAGSAHLEHQVLGLA
jgi:glycine cleavage system regulatory protein